MFTSNYEGISAIIPRVDFIGAAIRLLREQRNLKQEDVALAALGDTSPQKKRRDLANYLSKIEREKVPNVGLRKLRLIARGCGYATLGEFFSALENAHAAPINTSIAQLHLTRSGPHTASTQSGGGVPHGSHRVVRDDVADASGEVSKLRQALAEAGEILLNAGLSGARKPAAARGAGAAGRGAPARKSPKKNP